jgi:DNA-binding NtrC family response regulator
MEKLMITEILRRYDGDRRRASHDLGINPSTLYRKIKSLGIDVPESDGRRRRK